MKTCALQSNPLRLAVAAMGTAFAISAAATATAGDVTEQSRAETQPPFGGEMNVEYAQALWEAMAERELVGENAMRTYPYEGNHPHGQALEFIETTLSVDGQQGLVMVKKNYGGEGDFDTLKQNVLNDRMANLSSVTVMFQRESGYDPDHQDWYWAKFQPSGELENNPKGMPLAGRVAKGMNKGCIACHAGAPGGDYAFTHDRLGR